MRKEILRLDDKTKKKNEFKLINAASFFFLNEEQTRQMIGGSVKKKLSMTDGKRNFLSLCKFLSKCV
jgi:hypothetical protein